MRARYAFPIPGPAWAGLVCLALVLTCLAGPPALAEPVPLPIDEPLVVNEIQLDLRASKVQVVFDAEAEPRLKILDRENGEETTGFALLDDQGGLLAIGQPHGDADVAPRLNVTLTLKPNDRVTVRGSDLDVSIVDRSTAAPPDSEAAQAAAPVPARFGKRTHRVTLDLIGGGAQIDRAGDLMVKAQDATVSVAGTTGLIEFDLDHSDAAVEEHLGPIVLRATESDFEARSSQGNVGLDIVGGSVSLESGTGSVRSRMEGASAFLVNWQGEMFFEGESNQIQLLDSGMARSRCDMKGTNQGITIENFAGAIDARLTGGSIEATDVGGTVTIHGTSGTTVGLVEIRDLVELKLENSSTAEVERLQRRLRANIKQSRLDASEVRSVDIRATGSTVTVSDTDGAARVEITDSDADLDLRGTNGSPEVILHGRSNARVQLRDPCIVRASQPMEELSGRATVSGCESGSEVRRNMRQVGRSNLVPSILIIEVGDDSSLEVTGL